MPGTCDDLVRKDIMDRNHHLKVQQSLCTSKAMKYYNISSFRTVRVPLLLIFSVMEIYLILTLSMKSVTYTSNYDLFRERRVNQDKRERMIVLVPK